MSAKGTRCPQERGIVWSELWSETAGHPNPPPSTRVDVIDAQRGLEKGQAGPGSLLGSRASWRSPRTASPCLSSFISQKPMLAPEFGIHIYFLKQLYWG